METTIVYWGYIGIMEYKMETAIVFWGYIGIMENSMETTIVCWGYIGIMENKMETTIVYWGYIGIMENNMETTEIFLKFLVPSEGGAPEFPESLGTCRALRFSVWGLGIGDSRVGKNNRLHKEDSHFQRRSTAGVTFHFANIVIWALFFIFLG